jgi:hypothetical protein
LRVSDGINPRALLLGCPKRESVSSRFQGRRQQGRVSGFNPKRGLFAFKSVATRRLPEMESAALLQTGRRKKTI